MLFGRSGAPGAEGGRGFRLPGGSTARLLPAALKGDQLADPPADGPGQ